MEPIIAIGAILTVIFIMGALIATYADKDRKGAKICLIGAVVSFAWPIAGPIVIGYYLWGAIKFAVKGER